MDSLSPPAETAFSPLDEAQKASVRILVVDDERQIHSSVRLRLGRSYDIVSCTDPHSALERLAEERFELRRGAVFRALCRQPLQAQQKARRTRGSERASRPAATAAGTACASSVARVPAPREEAPPSWEPEPYEESLETEARDLGLSRLFCLTFETGFFGRNGFDEIAESIVSPDVYAELVRSPDEGVAEFLDLSRVKPNTLGNTRMLKQL